MTELSEAAIKAIDKIGKLLNLANNIGATEAEAALAAQKAQELMDAYNLDMATLSSRGKGDKEGDARKDEKVHGGLYQYQRTLWKHVAEMNFCMYWITLEGRKYRHRVLGSTVNVLSTKLMCEYLEGAIENLTRAHVVDPKEFFTRYANSYREGITSRIAEKITVERRRRMAEDDAKKKEEQARSRHPGAAPGTSLIVLSDVMQSERDKNDDYLYGEGYSARMRAAQAERLRAYEEAREMLEKWEREHPEEAAAKKEVERLEMEAWLKKEAKRAARRKPTVYRERRSNKDWTGYTAGYRDGDQISLNRQITKNGHNKLN